MKTLSEAALAATRALIDEDDFALVTAVESLAGKGVGFTPAGDDWLLGCIVALQSLRHPVKAARIAEAALPHTTPFSAASLKMAGKRKFAQPWHDLIKAGSSAQIHAAMLRLREYGHSSGADALTGFIQVLEALSPTPDRLST
ncbi:MAG: DUF2877 domain-containing protein [Anaerolineae bacterium]|nr:DUF2877 domain-containing protein [Anaerolineae bacterium]